MEFAVIDPQARMLRVVRARNLDAAMELIGLQRGGVVHAEVWPGLAIIVDHYSLMRTPSEQYYFAIGNDSDPLSPHRLFAGPAILYEYDSDGQTTDFGHQKALQITWINGPQGVEQAIRDGFVTRPVKQEDGMVLWEWQANPPKREKMN